MLGAFSVGKTSLVERYVQSVFSDKYLSTVGVKISKKEIVIDQKKMTLVLWDMEGKDLYANINLSYLRGAMGFFVVADGTRKETLETALQIRSLAIDVLSPLPHCLLINKADRLPDWEITDDMLRELSLKNITFLTTSAKTGQGVEEAFTFLAKAMMPEQGFAQ